jgi:hypothetical protein
MLGSGVMAKSTDGEKCSMRKAFSAWMEIFRMTAIVEVEFRRNDCYLNIIALLTILSFLIFHPKSAKTLSLKQDENSRQANFI